MANPTSPFCVTLRVKTPSKDDAGGLRAKRPPFFRLLARVSIPSVLVHWLQIAR